jgi:ribulose-phosphate 3-epimerase
MQTLIAPSILSADFAQLGDEIRAVENAGADWIHVDVMDGHFVPNLTLGPPVIQSLRKVTQLPLDVHLMIESPDRSIPDYASAGANTITVHAEACVHLHRTLSLIKSFNIQAGVAINPATPISAVQHVLHMVDLVLVMTVNPGFGGQSFIAETLPKIEALRTWAHAHKPSLHIEVDGGISHHTVAQVHQAGANVYVAGSAVFQSANYTQTIQQLRSLAL